MKVIYVFVCFMWILSCKNSTVQSPSSDQAMEASPAMSEGQAAVKDDESMKDVVKVAISSPDHTTLVTAIKQAELVNSLSNAGPFTVFAPTNDAFSKLPPGTVEELMKPAKKADLQNILQYHVTTSTLKAGFFKEGMTLGMVNGDHVSFQVADGKVRINNTATIIASIPASNGIIHVIDAVLLPPGK
ncbi:MAG: fasciclin domain-containing protein [Saprospiraceae bacterium]|nr:fasciclin domain-containing protein [Saprospiraceae bacterium]